MKKEIINFYLTNGIVMGNYQKICINDIGFTYNNFYLLLSLLKENNTIIETIELFDKNYIYTPPDYNYYGNNTAESFSLLNSFLNSIIFDKNEIISVIIKNPNYVEKINKCLQENI